MRSLSTALHLALTSLLLHSAVAVAAPTIPSESELIAIIHSPDSSENDLAEACQDLAAVGNEAAVPVLAKLLVDPKLSHYARYGLQTNPTAAAGEALLEATHRLEGDLLVGVLNSIGARKDAAATNRLAELMSGDTPVAQAAVGALVEIGGDAAIKSISMSTDANASKFADSYLERAELFAEAGRNEEAVAIYRGIRKLPISDHVAKAASIGLVAAANEQQAIESIKQYLASGKEWEFEAGLQSAVRSKYPVASQLLGAAIPNASSDRQLQLLAAIESRGDRSASPLVREALFTDNLAVRAAAITALGKLGKASDVDVLVTEAIGSDPQIKSAARDALAVINADQIEQTMIALLGRDKKNQLLAMEIIGRRRISAAGPQLVGIAKTAGAPQVRLNAIKSLTQIAPPELLPALLDLATAAKTEGERAAAKRAVLDTSLRVPDRDQAAELVASRFDRVPTDQRSLLLEAMAAIGGKRALSFVTDAANSDDRQLQDAGTRVLGSWSTPDAAPALLQIADSDHPDHVRSLRGYLRIARQLNFSDAERVEMVRKVLGVAERDDERLLALTILERVPTKLSLELAVSQLASDQLGSKASEAVSNLANEVAKKHPADAAQAAKKVLETGGDAGVLNRARVVLEQTEPK